MWQKVWVWDGLLRASYLALFQTLRAPLGSSHSLLPHPPPPPSLWLCTSYSTQPFPLTWPICDSFISNPAHQLLGSILGACSIVLTGVALIECLFIGCLLDAEMHH